MIPTIKTKRIYETSSNDDGYRVLIDRIWPRGITKLEADISEWVKDIAPSTELRKWFGHSPALYNEFRKKYKEELKHNKLVNQFIERNKHQKTITLLYAAKDTVCNNALVLRDFIMEYYEKN